MAGVLVLDAPRRGKAQFAGFDLPSYLKKHFNMYGGPEHSVTLRCTADLEPAMRERFGTSPILIPEGETHFHFTVDVYKRQQYAQRVADQCKDAKIITVPQGEGSKSFKILETVLRQMLEFNMEMCIRDRLMGWPSCFSQVTGRTAAASSRRAGVTLSSLEERLTCNCTPVPPPGVATVTVSPIRKTMPSSLWALTLHRG